MKDYQTFIGKANGIFSCQLYRPSIYWSST